MNINFLCHMYKRGTLYFISSFYVMVIKGKLRTDIIILTGKTDMSKAFRHYLQLDVCGNNIGSTVSQPSWLCKWLDLYMKNW